MNRYIHYGCGLTAPNDWENFDASPTLQIQKIPFLGYLFKNRLNTLFPDNVKYGDIIKGLPIQDDSCDGIYCSHVLEHLALDDFRKAISNTYKILRFGGIFRCVVPDLETYARNYLTKLESGDAEASIGFLNDSLLGEKSRVRGIKGLAISQFGNANHLWMWDFLSLAAELRNAGFKNIKRCKFNDSSDKAFNLVEDEGRFKDAVAIECTK
ncbi:MAG: methyltransferase domain-containing protein [Bacteroidetes bacterium]|nr:methyltransferase domain-containing protein [Bacteroidota bacterium]